MNGGGVSNLCMGIVEEGANANDPQFNQCSDSGEVCGFGSTVATGSSSGRT